MMKSERKEVVKKTLHVGSPNIGDMAVFQQLVEEIFERRWFTNSGVVEKEFERQLCEYLSVKHCIPVCNATVGLQLVCHALDLTGEVILPAFTFVATPHAVQWEGLKPVFADVSLDDHTLCPRSVESLINQRTSAILGVHVWGNSCQTEELQAVAEQYNLELFYDSAHAFACRHGENMIGNFGRCEVFSFHATKFFNTFEGGAIATNDDALAEKIRLMKNFGFAGMDKVIHLGTNAKMTEICAAMGISVMAKLQDIINTNQLNHDRYASNLAEKPGVRLLRYDHIQQSNWQYVVVEIEPALFGASRDDVFENLMQNDIRARRYFYPGCHRMEPYLSLQGDVSSRLPNTEQLCQTVLCLPNGSAVDESDVDRVCELLLSTNA